MNESLQGKLPDFKLNFVVWTAKTVLWRLFVLIFRYYNHYKEGEYVFYRHATLPYEVNGIGAIFIFEKSENIFWHVCQMHVYLAHMCIHTHTHMLAHTHEPKYAHRHICTHTHAQTLTHTMSLFVSLCVHLCLSLSHTLTLSHCLSSNTRLGTMFCVPDSVVHSQL